MTPFVGELAPQLEQDAHRRFCLPYLRAGQERRLMRWHGIIFTSRGNFELGHPTTAQSNVSELVCAWESNFPIGVTTLNQLAVVAGDTVVCDNALSPQEVEVGLGDLLRLIWRLSTVCKQ